MKALPRTKDALVLRTDFSNDVFWKAVCSEICEPVGEFRAYVEFVSDSSYAGLSVGELVELASKGNRRTFLFVVDEVTTSDPEHPLLAVDLYAEPGRTFRVVPREMWGVENNLSVGNMDFEEFAEGVDQDGVFRGFSES